MLDNPSYYNFLVRGSAWLSFLCYMATLIGWSCRWPSTRLRRLWTMAWMIFVIHVCLAFEMVHQWSHWKAWEATLLQGGYGDGIYLNYLMLAVWLLDVAWWWLLPTQHAQRNTWTMALIHGFLLFMWFNAAVIFAKDYLYLVSGSLFVLLGWLTFWRWSHAM